MSRRHLAILVASALLLSACSLIGTRAEACVPVDEGGDCFTPTHDGFIAHALTSAHAWPQLDGEAVEATDVIEGFDAAAGQPTWIVPVTSNGRIVAASRFLRFGTTGQVRLGEVALYQPSRASFPVPAAGQRLVIFAARCADPLPDSCLFAERGWRLEATS